MLDKINKKISAIIKLSEELAKVKTDLTKKVELIYESMCELQCVINDKIELVNRIGGAIDHIMSEIKNETNMIDEKIHKVSEMDNGTQHLINDKLEEIINQSRKDLSKIVV